MTKKVIERNGKKNYLLGSDEYGVYYWLEAPSWDCGWYWGFGYIENYTNNKRPDLAKDITRHTHFDYLFFNKPECGYHTFKELLVEKTLSDDELWKLLDYMKTFYTLQKAAAVFGEGNSHYTEKAKIDTIKNEEMCNTINKVMLPELFKKIDELLTKEEE